MADAIRTPIETLFYGPDVQTSGDLEAATKVITATVEATGTGNADYSSALTLAAPSSAKLQVLRIAARLSFTIDSFDVATILYCRVYVDVQDANHLLFDTSHNAASNKLAAQDTLVGTKEVIFDLLKDGAAHTFYFFFWVNQATSATISVVQVWEGVGTSSASAGGSVFPFLVAHKGWISVSVFQSRVGTGTPTTRYAYVGYSTAYFIEGWTGTYGIDGVNVAGRLSSILCDDNGNGRLRCELWGTVATDLNYCDKIALLMKNP